MKDLNTQTKSDCEFGKFQSSLFITLLQHGLLNQVVFHTKMQVPTNLIIHAVQLLTHHMSKSILPNSGEKKNRKRKCRDRHIS